MRNEWPPDAFRFIVQFGIELDGIVRIVSGTLKPVTIAEWEVFAWHRPNEKEISHGRPWRDLFSLHPS